MFPELFRVLPNFHECIYNSIETRSTCFLFLLENTATRKKNNLLTLIIKMLILFARAITTSTARAVVLCLHRVTQTRFLPISAPAFLGLFSKFPYILHNVMLMLTVLVPKGAWATCDETPVKRIRQKNTSI